MSQLLRGVIISQCLSFKITNSFKTFFLTCQSLRVWKFLNGHQSLVWLHCFWSCDPAFRVYGKLGHCPQDKLKIIKSETPFRTSKLLTFWSRIPVLWFHEKNIWSLILNKEIENIIWNTKSIINRKYFTSNNNYLGGYLVSKFIFRS